MHRRKQPRLSPDRTSVQQGHLTCCYRSQRYVSLLALSLALFAVLTLRRTGSRAGTKTVDITNQGNSLSWPQSEDITKEGVARGEWNADDGIPSVPWSEPQSEDAAEEALDREIESKGTVKGIPSVPRSEMDIHVVFSTDCSPYQNYQSMLLFHSAETVKQEPVTRVASGCSQEEEEELRAFMSKQPERFRVHFTPDYSRDAATGKRFPYYNKPNGLAHFLKNADPPVEETVIALVDPDMVFVKRLTPFVGNSGAMLWVDRDSESGEDWVVEGKPVAQKYGLGGIWAVWPDLGDITQKLGADSPANQVGREVAASGYPVGPPYMLHTRDWTRVVDLWVDMCPEVYSRHPGILADMYAYCIAAAHLGLRHRVSNGLMVSDFRTSEEGWPLVEPLGAKACDASAVEERREYLPTVLHYCQVYRVGTYFFAKRHQALCSFFTCTANSLKLPPPDYLTSPMGLVRIHPNKQENMTVQARTRNGYQMCSMLRSLNTAQAAYKQRYCAPEEVSGGVQKLTDLPTALGIDHYG